MKIILIVMMVCILNILCAGNAFSILNTKYHITVDTLPPNPSNMQPVPPSTVNGNGTPILPPDSSKHIIDTVHAIH